MYNIRFVVVVIETFQETSLRVALSFILDGAGTVSAGASSFICRDDVHIVPTDTDIFVDVSGNVSTGRAVAYFRRCRHRLYNGHIHLHIPTNGRCHWPAGQKQPPFPYLPWFLLPIR